MKIFHSTEKSLNPAQLMECFAIRTSQDSFHMKMNMYQTKQDVSLIQFIINPEMNWNEVKFFNMYRKIDRNRKHIPLMPCIFHLKYRSQFSTNYRLTFFHVQENCFLFYLRMKTEK